jgi:hypothetical protein
MRNVDHHRTAGLRPASFLAASLGGVLILVSLAAAPSTARALESAYCQNLRAQIAQAGGDGRSYGGSGGRQRAELQRLQSRSASLGCDRGGFLFFDGGAPTECAGLRSRIARLATVVASPAPGGGYWGGARNALLARYDADCRHGGAAPRQDAGPANIFEAIFGAPWRQPTVVDGAGGVVANPGDPGFGDEDWRAHGGSEAICVRQCDGGFFPVSYSANRGNLSDLNALCQAQCPNAEASIYTKSLWRDVETAVSMDGEPYMNLPNALKFQRQRVAACACKPPGESWAQAMEGAERLLSFAHPRDSLVTAEEAERLSRPLPAGAVSRRVYSPQSTRRDARPLDAPVAPPPPQESAAALSADQGVYREVTGPDGVTKRVRVIAPAL